LGSDLPGNARPPAPFTPAAGACAAASAAASAAALRAAACAANSADRAASSFAAQHFLYFWPEPQWHGSFLPIFMVMHLSARED
jgi:hypothetical protein